MSKINSLISYVERKRNCIDYWRKRGAIIGDNCEIFSDVSFGSEPYLIKIGNHVRITKGVCLITHDGGAWVLRYLRDEDKNIDLIGPITIGDNVHIGFNSIIMPGVNVGSNVIIGCNAIVTKDIPDNCVVAGIPARIIESIDEYRNKHKSDFINTKALNESEKEILLKKYFRYKE